MTVWRGRMTVWWGRMTETAGQNDSAAGQNDRTAEQYDSAAGRNDRNGAPFVILRERSDRENPTVRRNVKRVIGFPPFFFAGGFRLRGRGSRKQNTCPLSICAARRPPPERGFGRDSRIRAEWRFWLKS